MDNEHHGPGSGSLQADAHAMYVAMLDAAAGGPEPDIEVCDVVGRHGLDPLAAVLTGPVRISLEKAAVHRGCTQDELLDEYLDELFRERQGDRMRDVVAGQVRTGSHRAISDADELEAFVWALVSLDVRAVGDVRAVIDGVAAGKSLRLGAQPGPVRAALAHRLGAARHRGLADSTLGPRPVFDHACTAECVPFHEHPGLGCRALHVEVSTRKRRRG